MEGTIVRKLTTILAPGSGFSRIWRRAPGR